MLQLCERAKFRIPACSFACGRTPSTAQTAWTGIACSFASCMDHKYADTQILHALNMRFAAAWKVVVVVPGLVQAMCSASSGARLDA